MDRLRALTAPFLLLLGVVAAVVALWRPFLGEGLHTGDFPGHVAMIRVLSDILAADPSLPLWNGRENLGTSLVVAYLHPIGSLLLLSPFTLAFGAEWGLGVGCIFYLSLAALSMYAWCVSWGGSRAGAALGALVYVLHPAVFQIVGGAGQMHQPVTLAILPLVFLAWSRLAAEPVPRRVVVASVASALLLLDMQRFFLAMPFVAIVYLATSRRTAASLAAGLGALAGIVLLLCFPVLPLLSERSLLQWHHPEAIAAWRSQHSLADALALVDRDGFFSRVVAPVAPDAPASAGGWYQGIVAIVFVALGSLWVARGAQDPARRLRLALTFTCLPIVIALAFGPHRLFTTQLELGQRLLAAGAGGAVAVAALIAVGLAFFASLGWLRAELLARFPGRRGYVDASVVSIALFLGLAAPFDLLSDLVFVYDHIRAPAHFAHPLLGFLLGSAACLVAPAWQRVAGTPARATVVLLLVAGLHVLDVLPYASRVAPELRPRPEARLREAFEALAQRPQGRVFDMSGYSPLCDMLAVGEAERGPARGWLSWMLTRHSSELLMSGVALPLAIGEVERAAQVAGLANIRFFSRIALTGGQLPESEALAPVVQRRGVAVSENLRVLPYAQLYPRIAWVSGPNVQRLPLVARLARSGLASYSLDLLADDARPEGLPDFVSGDDAGRLAPGVRPVPADLGGLEDVAAPCEVFRPRDTEVRLRCQLDSPGYLVIAESWSPRWRVQVDGEPRPLLRLNHAFQGVAVAAGDEHLSFGYQASPLTRVSLVVSATSWLSLLALAVFALLRGR